MNFKKLLPLIGIIVFVYIFLNLDITNVYLNFSSINIIYLVLSFCAIIPILILTNYQWQIILKKQKINVSFLYSLKNILIGYFYGFITPGGLGAYSRILYLHNESKAPLQKCMSNIILFNIIDYISLLFLGLIGAFLLSPYYTSLFYFIIIIFIIWIFLFISFLRKKILRGIIKKIIESRLFNPYKNKVETSIEIFYKDMPTLKNLAVPFFISIFGWIIRFSEFFLISRLFYIEISFIYFIFIVAIANIIASIPITIYGLGTREASLISLFAIFFISPEKIVSLSMFWFLIIWLTPSLFGSIITYLESKKFD